MASLTNHKHEAQIAYVRREEPGNPQENEMTWWPTRKWWAGTITATTAFFGSWAASGWDWTSQRQGTLITLAGAFVAAYVIQNQDTPAGVPQRGKSRF
jgi:hypothetical protein